MSADPFRPGLLARIFYTRHPLAWVAQATRLCRSATRRPESGVTDWSCDASLLPRVAYDLPPGQWPGGTGESPVPPRNYEICGLALCVWLAMVSSPVAAAAEAEPAPSSPDLLRFLDGAILHGALQSVDAARGLRWQHPDANAPFDLMPAHVDFVRFPQARSLVLTPTCHVRFAGGDNLFGSLVSLDGGTLEFNTWFGGTMKIPRAAVQTITFLPKNYSIVYEGPADASGWVVTAGKPNGVTQRIVLNGNVVIVGGGQLMFSESEDVARGGPPGPPNWTYQDGSFVTAGGGSLARNFNLTGSSTLEFDLACNGPFNLLLDLYSPALDRIEMNNKSLVVELDSGAISLLRASPAPLNENRSVAWTNWDAGGKPARVTFHCNKEEGSLAVLVDGVEVKRWTDLGSFADMGTGFVVQNQRIGGTVKLSHFKISRWEGQYEPDIAPAGATNADLVFLINHDQAGGKVESITRGTLEMNLGGSVLHIPSGRVRQIDFAQSSALPEPRGPWGVRAVLPGGGSVSFQLERWDDKSIAGRSALFGSLAFHPGSIRQMEFNLDQLRTEPAASPENQFDALDQ